MITHRRFFLFLSDHCFPVLGLCCLILLSSCAATKLPHVSVADSIPKEGANTLSSKAASELQHIKVAYQQLISAQSPAESADRIAAYNREVEDFVLRLQKEVPPKGWDRPYKLQLDDTTVELRFDSPDKTDGFWAPLHFEQVVPASHIPMKGLLNPVMREGVGFPVLMACEDSEPFREEYPFVPKNGVYLPATAFVDFKTDPKTKTQIAHLHFQATLQDNTADLGGKSLDLAYNHSAAVQMALGSQYLYSLNFGGLLKPADFVKDQGLYFMDGYREGRIPVIFVHGLDSAPPIWKNVVNEILRDPALRKRYWVGYYLYPTGFNIPRSSLDFRESLAKAREFYDSNEDDMSLDETLIFGHSMGGIVTRMQVIDSGEHFWDAYFTKPLEEIPVETDRTRHVIENAAYFEAHPSITRVVFLCVPHRGSALADLGIVRRLVGLIELPLDVARGATELFARKQDFVNPALNRYQGLGLRSVDNLSPEHPFYEALNAVPIQAKYHSIIGDRGKGNGAESSDGVVPYSSSHVPGAESEVFVPHGHSCTNEEATVNEMLRIMRLHAGIKE